MNQTLYDLKPHGKQLGLNLNESSSEPCDGCTRVLGTYWHSFTIKESSREMRLCQHCVEGIKRHGISGLIFCSRRIADRLAARAATIHALVQALEADADVRIEDRSVVNVLDGVEWLANFSQKASKQ